MDRSLFLAQVDSVDRKVFWNSDWVVISGKDTDILSPF